MKVNIPLTSKTTFSRYFTDVVIAITWQYFMVGVILLKHLNLVGPNNRKNLKIPVFGGPRVYLVIFEFVAMEPQENLVFFDL